jgi:hypothetical protein
MPTTLTEVHDALADAWVRLSGPAAHDSAAAHWRYVAAAWERGDPPYAPRAAAARRHLASGAASISSR